MLYTVLFAIRYLPFWAIPFALVTFELGIYHFNRRERFWLFFFLGWTFAFSAASLMWVIFEGYWRAGPIVKRFWESFQ